MNGDVPEKKADQQSDTEEVEETELSEKDEEPAGLKVSGITYTQNVYRYPLKLLYAR